MKDKLKISEFAKLRNITTETLRHYDRVELLKPIDIDANTGYRYYSPFQSEKLSTILDLKALGFSIKEMKDYFSQREVRKSYELLREKHMALKEKIENLNEVEKSIKKKIDYLASVMELKEDKDYTITTAPEQLVAFVEEALRDSLSYEFAITNLESKLKILAPTIGVDTYGMIIKKSSISDGNPLENANIIHKLESKNDIDKKYIRTLPERTIASFILSGKVIDHSFKISEMLKKIEADGYEVNEEIIVFYKVDCSVTDLKNEDLREYQVLISNKVEE